MTIGADDLPLEFNRCPRNNPDPATLIHPFNSTIWNTSKSFLTTTIRPKSGSQGPAMDNQQPHDDLYAEQPKEEHKPAVVGPNLPPTQEYIAAPAKRVIGPAMPSAELLAAAAKFTETEAELRETEISEDDDALFIGPPPPAVVKEAVSANDAERFAEVTRIRVAEIDNPYDIVGVNRYMAAESIKKRYWKPSLMVHPDKCPHPEAHQAFIKLNKAFKDLQDPVNVSISAPLKIRMLCLESVVIWGTDGWAQRRSS